MGTRSSTGADCLFCRIAAAKAPADVLHRDDLVVAFRDVRPVAPIHVLIVPKRHIESIQDDSAEDEGVLDRMGAVARRLASELGVTAQGYRLVINSGADAGQTVFHLHMHLIAGRKLHWPPG